MCELDIAAVKMQQVESLEWKGLAGHLLWILASVFMHQPSFPYYLSPKQATLLRVALTCSKFYVCKVTWHCWLFVAGLIPIMLLELAAYQLNDWSVATGSLGAEKCGLNCMRWEPEASEKGKFKFVKVAAFLSWYALQNVQLFHYSWNIIFRIVTYNLRARFHQQIQQGCFWCRK